MSAHRQKCLEEKGRDCHICGSSGDIQVHHINGDRADNSLENLIPVCTGCHATIHDDSDELEEWSEKLLPISERTRRVSMTVTPEEQDLIELIRETSGADTTQEALLYAVRERVDRIDTLSEQRRFLREIKKTTENRTDERAVYRALGHYTHFLTDLLDGLEKLDARDSTKEEIASILTSEHLTVEYEPRSVALESTPGPLKTEVDQ